MKSDTLPFYPLFRWCLRSRMYYTASRHLFIIDVCKWVVKVKRFTKNLHYHATDQVCLCHLHQHKHVHIDNMVVLKCNQYLQKVFKMVKICCLNHWILSFAKYGIDSGINFCVPEKPGVLCCTWSVMWLHYISSWLSVFSF